MGLNTKIHLAVDAHGMPVRILITDGTTAQANRLIEGIDAEYLLADKDYDTDTIVKNADDQGMQVVIPLKRNRRHQRYCDKEIYKLRCLVENAFSNLKRWRWNCNKIRQKYFFFLGCKNIPKRRLCSLSIS